jgi:hypothetical protein
VKTTPGPQVSRVPASPPLPAAKLPERPARPAQDDDPAVKIPSLPTIEIQRKSALETKAWDALTADVQERILGAISDVKKAMGLGDVEQLTIKSKTSDPGGKLAKIMTLTFTAPRILHITTHFLDYPKADRLERDYDGRFQKDILYKGDKVVETYVGIPAWESRQFDDPSFQDVMLNPKRYAKAEEVKVATLGADAHRLFTGPDAISLTTNDEGPLIDTLYIDKQTGLPARMLSVLKDTGRPLLEIRFLNYRETHGLRYPMRREDIVSPRLDRDPRDSPPGAYVTEVTDVKVIRRRR